MKEKYGQMKGKHDNVKENIRESEDDVPLLLPHHLVISFSFPTFTKVRNKRCHVRRSCYKI